MSLSIERAIAFALYSVGAILLFVTSPHHGEFWWSDSPRHALNGVFVKDLIAAMPTHPTAWAEHYYVQYPALTILFYPPLFYIISAPFYALFGVSHATALSVVLMHYFVLSCGLHLLARNWMSPLVAIAVGLSAMAVPGIALWGRQVMLEVPSIAFAVWAVLVLRSHVATNRTSTLYLALFLLICAAYVKLTAIFLFPVFALTLFVARGPGVLRDRRIWGVAILTVVGLIPLIYLTVIFGGANVQSVVGIPDAAVSRRTIAGWIWYARLMPGLTGWPLLALSVLAFPFAIAGRLPSSFTRSDRMLLGGWLVIGYVFLSMIDLKEARHALVILPPLLVAAGLSVTVLLSSRIGGASMLALVLGTGVYTWLAAPVPFYDGYREAAEWIAREAPKDATIAFSGKRDGSFVFNMRSIETRHDITTLRVDKLLLDAAVRRELGVQQKMLSEQEIGDLLDRDGVSYVVAQDDFWTDLQVMARFQSVLRSPHFSGVAHIPVVTNVPSEDKVLRIYRNLGNVATGPHTIDLHLGIINQNVSGTAGR